MDKKIGFFCMEFGIIPELNIYAGGLGVLSGDILKGASDLNIPMVGVSLLYKYGNFRQKINEKGEQIEFYKEIDISKLPIRKLDLKVEVNIKGKKCSITPYELEIGNSKLFLLSSEETDYLYPSEPDKRISQEVILGAGGVKLLSKLGLDISLYHLNEGHTIFVIIERLSNLIKKGISFERAKKIIKESTIFTTHTPEIAGNENYEWQIIEPYIKPFFEGTDFDISIIKESGLKGDIFWFPLFAMRFSKYVNAVSLLHKRVCDKMWGDFNIKIDYITNGIHKSWIAENLSEILKKYKDIDEVPDEELWKLHIENKKKLIEFVKKKTGKEIDVNELILTYAKRIVEYKRPYLLFMNIKRLKNILEKNPLKIILSGKAHPSDFKAKEILKDIFNKVKGEGLDNKVIFIEDYDMEIAKYLVQGSDVWLNVPVRGREACGTSGMKAMVNGSLHISTLDGWWCEAYKGDNGFKIGGKDYSNSEERDKKEAEELYNIIEEICNIYFNKKEKWLKIMKNSIKTVKEGFMAERMLREYGEKYR